MTSTTSELAAFDFNKIRWAYFGLLIGMFASSISQTIVSPAIPRIVADLGGMAYYAWLSTIVMLVAAVVTPISGKLSDIFGRRRFYIVGLVIFMVGSALSGLAMSFYFLIFSRAVQGVGMGILMPLSQTILGDLIPARQRGKYQGYMGAVMGASQVAGPLIGGWITDVSSWRWLFYIALPVGLVALFIIVRHLRIPELDVASKIDYAGISTMTVGVTATLLGISLGGTTGWRHPQVLAMLGLGVVFLVAFVLVELRAAEPIVPMRLFGNSVFTWSTLAAFAMNMALMSIVIYVPVYAQGVLGVSATQSGLILIPMNVALFAAGIVIGQLTSRTGRYKEFMVGGTGVMLVGALLMTRLGGDSTPGALTLVTMVFGLGVGMAFQLYTLAVQNSVQRRDLGVATSALQFFRNIGNTLGTAVAGSIMATRLASGVEAGMTPEIVEQLPASGLNVNDVLQPDVLAVLPPDVARLLHDALAGAMQGVFAVVPILALASMAATLFIKPLPLRETLGTLEEQGRGLLDSTAMSSPDMERVLSSPEDYHLRSRERLMGAHLLMVAEQVGDANPILRDAVTEFGGGDLARGLQLLRSTGTMLLAQDPATIDAHEAFAVELSKRGKRAAMLSDELTDRLYQVSSRVAIELAQTPVKPHTRTVDGIDGAGLERAVWMLNSALVADLASRRWPEPGSAAGPGEPDRKV